VARTPEGYYSLDGWDLIESARETGVASVMVDVVNMDAHSDEELCLQKMAVRLKTRGEALYPEIFRNTRDINQMLLSTNEDLKEFSHGGRRDKAPLNNVRESDAMEILARRMRKDRDTVGKHLLHCKYLSDTAIAFLVENKAKKTFFEAIQRKKQAMISRLHGIEADTIAITEAISEFIVNAFIEASAPKEDSPLRGSAPPPQAPPESNVASEDNDSDDDEQESPTGEDEQESPTGGDAGSPEEMAGNPIEPLTLETIKDRVTTITKRILDDVSGDISLAEIRARLQEELQVITGLLSSIDALNSGRE
jgi:hypothetical protein